MTKGLFIIASVALITTQACNNEQKTPETVTETITVTDTVTQVVEKPAEVDTASIIAYYESQRAKAKGTPNKATKKVESKMVSVDSDPAVVSDDAMVVPAPSAAAPAAPEVKVIHDVQMYYFIPDEQASFPGGEAAFDKYLTENLQYPKAALEAGMSRTVYATLFLDEQGNPTDVKFRYQPTIYGFQDEARRILMSSPRWNPAKQGGQPVKSKFTIPISFKIN